MNDGNSLITFQECTRTGPFWTAFRDRGYKLEEYVVDTHAMVRMTSPNDKVWLTSTNISYPMVSSASHAIAANKYWTYSLAEAAGVCIPRTVLISGSELQSANELLTTSSPLIVKPLDSYGSKGLTLNITSEQTLSAAIEEARLISSEVLVQEQVDGDELRFTIVDGKVVSVLLRQSPQLVGDGSSTIQRLLQRDNENRQGLDFGFIKYPQLTPELIEGHFFEDNTIPASGDVITLSRATMVRRGASVYEIGEQVDDSYKDIANKVAHELGSQFMTVDIFIKDRREPANNTNYWFNECNTAPALRLYYADRNRKGPAIAELIVNKMDHMIREGM